MKENKQFWNLYAPEFDAIYGTDNSFFNNLINKLFRKAMSLRFQKTLSSIPDELVSVIDIGCGPGHYCIELAKSGKRIVNGLDFSEKMIELSRTNAINNGLKNIQFYNSDILSFNKSTRYDYCVMMGFIEYFQNPGEILQKAVSLTEKKILISFPAKGGILAFQRKLRYKRKCFLKMYSEAQIKALLHDCNLNSFEIQRISRDYFVTISL